MKRTILLLVSFFIINLIPTYPQGLFDKIKDKVKEKVDQKTDEGIDKGIEETEEAIEEGVQKKEGEEENSEESSEENSEQNADEEQTEKAEKKDDPKPKTELKTYSKFDFVPGEKVIYFEDFSQDAVGDFPALWNTNASGEVVTTNLFSGKWFKLTGTGWYIPESIPQLPDNFTVQFDIFFECPEEEVNAFDFGMRIIEGSYNDPNEGGAIPGKAGLNLWFNRYQVNNSNYADGSYILDGHKDFEMSVNEIIKVSISAQKQRVRWYINETKVFDMPKGLPANHQYNIFRFENTNACAPHISNIRLAIGAPDMRNKLITEGKLVTRGILFDVNSDKIKPESYGTLKEIANVLKENADVKVKIVGHTDSDGKDDANLDLSKRRAASVKVSLNKEFGIEDSRMETDGKGESEPSDKNDTPQGKANNRRVEFIKL